MDGISQLNSLTKTSAVMQNTRINQDQSKFEDLVRNIQNENRSNVSSAEIVKDGHINGDIKTDFENTFTSESDKKSLPTGAAANNASVHSKSKTIDKTSKLYEKALELESFFVKIMVDSMRKTVTKASGENNFAQNMYDDMLYDEYTTAMTKKAGFGLADQIYEQLSVLA